LVTDAPLGDFQITTKVTISPTQDYQTAGILYYQDNDNYLNLVYVHDHGTWVSFHKEIGGNVGFIAYPDQITTSTVYLRIDRQDTAFTGYFSTDGNVWNEVGLQIIAIVNPKVGIDTSNGPVGVEEIPADFDFFKLVGNSTTFLPLILR
jgi:beta-xylosidase